MKSLFEQYFKPEFKIQGEFDQIRIEKMDPTLKKKNITTKR